MFNLLKHFYLLLYSVIMVYIKLTNQMWIVSGLEKLINQTVITKINNDRYIPYPQFKKASELTDQPIHTLVKRDHIISNIDMKKIIRQSQRTPQQRRAIQQLKIKHEIRAMNKYKKMTNDEYYFQQKKNQSVKDVSSSLSFAMTFIFSFFMAGLTGYYFGTYFLGLSFVHALIVSIVFIMGTIIVQTTLFIIKQDRQDKLKAKESKNNIKTFQFERPSPYPRPQQPGFKQQTNNKRRPKID